MIQTYKTSNDSLTKLRRWWLVASIAYLGLVIYGSLVPFDYKPLEWNTAVAQFQEIPFLNLNYNNRSDWAVNILLFIPLAFLWCGVLVRNEHRQSRAVLTTLALFIGLSLLAMSIEFTQQWFSSRTTSQNDIVAESLGGLIGCICWFLFGHDLQRWILKKKLTTDPAYYIERALWVYTIGLLFYSVMPLDMVVSWEELQLKSLQGKIRLWPQLTLPASVEEWSRVLTQIAIFVPVGFLLGLRRSRQNRQSYYTISFLGVIGLALLIELTQLMIHSRHTTVNDLLWKTFGGVLGASWALIWLASRRFNKTGQKSAVPQPSMVKFVVGMFLMVFYAAFVCVVFWWPFEQVSSTLEVNLLWQDYWQVPFTNYYWGTEFNALTNILQKILLLMPLGYLLRVSIQYCPLPAHLMPALVTSGVVILAVFSVVIERGQAVYGGHYPDITDSMLYLVGVVMGVALHGMLHTASRTDVRNASAGSRPYLETPSDVIRIES